MKRRSAHLICTIILLLFFTLSASSEGGPVPACIAAIVSEPESVAPGRARLAKLAPQRGQNAEPVGMSEPQSGQVARQSKGLACFVLFGPFEVARGV